MSECTIWSYSSWLLRGKLHALAYHTLVTRKPHKLLLQQKGYPHFPPKRAFLFDALILQSLQIAI